MATGAPSMPDMPPGLAAEDLGVFRQEMPGQASAAQKLLEAQQKMDARDKKLLTPKQMEGAEKFAEQIRHADEAAARQVLVRHINAYKQTFPVRLESIKLPKDLDKLTLEKLQQLHDEITKQLGRGGGVNWLVFGWQQAMQGIETYHHVVNPFGWNLNGLLMMSNTVMQKETMPLLEELAIKYDAWFSYSVEARILQHLAGIIMTTHRLNSEGVKQFMQKAVNTPAPDSLRKMAENL